MVAKKPSPLSQATRPVLSTIMGKPAPIKVPIKQKVPTVLGGSRGK